MRRVRRASRRSARCCWSSALRRATSARATPRRRSWTRSLGRPRSRRATRAQITSTLFHFRHDRSEVGLRAVYPIARPPIALGHREGPLDVAVRETRSRGLTLTLGAEEPLTIERAALLAYDGDELRGVRVLTDGHDLAAGGTLSFGLGQLSETTVPSVGSRVAGQSSSFGLLLAE